MFFARTGQVFGGGDGAGFGEAVDGAVLAGGDEEFFGLWGEGGGGY